MCKQNFVEVIRPHGAVIRINVGSIEVFDDESVTISGVRYNLVEDSMIMIKEILS